MNSLYLVLLLASTWTACCLKTVLADYEKVCTRESKREGTQGRCGPRLREFITEFCKGHGGIYGGGRPSKRSIRDIIMPRKTALAYLRKRRSVPNPSAGEQNIVCECCYNVCSTKEYVEYCSTSRSSGSTKINSPQKVVPVVTSSYSSRIMEYYSKIRSSSLHRNLKHRHVTYVDLGPSRSRPSLFQG